MTKTVTMRDASEHFAEYAREVVGGEEIILTEGGEPVAKIVPLPGKRRPLTPDQEQALQDILDFPAKGYVSKSRYPTREELYDDILRERLAVYRR